MTDLIKAINDGFGHTTGDRALQEVAKTLAGALRTTDMVARWGGDEFIAIARHLNSKTLEVLTERCCALVAQTTLRDDGRTVSLSVSIGGTLVLPDDTATRLLERADELMYKSKKGGRARATTR